MWSTETLIRAKKNFVNFINVKDLYIYYSYTYESKILKVNGESDLQKNVVCFENFFRLARFLYDNYVADKLDTTMLVPKDCKPLSYTLHLKPYFSGPAKYPWYKNMTFEGTVTVITFKKLILVLK